MAEQPRADAEKIAVLERLKRRAWRGFADLHNEMRGLTGAEYALLNEADHDRLAREALSSSSRMANHG